MLLKLFSMLQKTLTFSSRHHNSNAGIVTLISVCFLALEILQNAFELINEPIDSFQIPLLKEFSSATIVIPSNSIEIDFISGIADKSVINLKHLIKMNKEESQANSSVHQVTSN